MAWGEKPLFVMDMYHFIYVWGATLFDIMVHGMMLYWITKHANNTKAKVI